jgi:hypothetical protein
LHDKNSSDPIGVAVVTITEVAIIVVAVVTVTVESGMVLSRKKEDNVRKEEKKEGRDGSKYEDENREKEW